MAENLSKGYKTMDEAAMGGFKKVMSGNHPNKSDEYAFYILLVVENHQIGYRYTSPVKLGSSGGELKFTPSKGQQIRAYCHSHPQRLSEENFSAADFTEFKRTYQLYTSMTWYLLTPREQIRVAKSEADFRAGKEVTWNPSVLP